MEPERNFKKLGTLAKVNYEYKTDTFRNFFAASYNTTVHTANVQCIDNDAWCRVFPLPFKHVVLPNFLADTGFIHHLVKELEGLEMLDKNIDLFKFQQSVELMHVNLPCIEAFRTMLKDDMLSVLREATGISLDDTVDMFCSKYNYTDTLLCHDDELEGRRLAYIYYLVPSDWSEQDGGNLDLFDTDDKGQPNEVVKSIVPKFNQFLFFEVTPVSFHQVSEVLTESKTRLALSGWFHGTPVSRNLHHVEPTEPLVPCGSVDEQVFFDWLNPVYISQEIQNDIRERFEAESELELVEFLKEDKYDELMSALTGVEMVWEHRGPPNKRSYDVCRRECFPPVLQTFVDILRSDAMFLLLGSMTGLHLHEHVTANGVVDGCDDLGINAAKCRLDVQRFGHGDYTLLHDTDPHVGEMALDLVLFVGGKDWTYRNGGYISYVAKEEDEELLSIVPSPNCLALVYKDRDTLRFFKHLNHRVTKATSAKETSYCAVAATYYENAG